MNANNNSNIYIVSPPMHKSEWVYNNSLLTLAHAEYGIRYGHIDPRYIR